MIIRLLHTDRFGDIITLYCFTCNIDVGINYKKMQEHQSHDLRRILKPDKKDKQNKIDFY